MKEKNTTTSSDTNEPVDGHASVDINPLQPLVIRLKVQHEAPFAEHPPAIQSVPLPPGAVPCSSTIPKPRPFRNRKIRLIWRRNPLLTATISFRQIAKPGTRGDKLEYIDPKAVYEHIMETWRLSRGLKPTDLLLNGVNFWYNFSEALRRGMVDDSGSV